MSTNKTKTVFCDIDGTLIKHCGDICKQGKMTEDEIELLPSTLDAIRKWDKLGYNIVLTTGRKESLREKTITQLSDLGIIYDQLIMGIGGGKRILINDKKESATDNQCFAINVVRNKGLPEYDFESRFVTVRDDYPKKVEKPWGGEELIEYNDHYVMKKLFMKAGQCCSMQYHELKRETVYVLSGKLKLYIGQSLDQLEEKVMCAGESITIEPFTIHRMEGIEDSYYLEASTNELYDVVRLNDKYGRK
jgi:mannose-6-phosphate isomerase-like protein (cupin superfamily)